MKNIVLSPASYGIELDSVPDVPYFTEVKAPARIDVKVAAKLADMSEEDFSALNPAHNKAVASSGTLILPVDRADSFRTNLESYDKQPLVSWTTYQAKRGESLDAIAKHNNLSLVQIKAANSDLKLDKRNRLRAAGPLMVPMKGAQPVVAELTLNKAADASAAPAPAPAAESGRTYTVRGGDTLYGIALTPGTSVQTLLQVNHLSTKAVLQPGMKLKIP